jgi:hypothetical protein
MATRTQQQQKQYIPPGLHRPFTQEMRDRQARGKDPYHYSGSSISTNTRMSFRPVCGLVRGKLNLSSLSPYFLEEGSLSVLC